MLLATMFIFGCGSRPVSPAKPTSLLPIHVTPTPRPLTLATTSSTQDTGLLDVLLPCFCADTEIDVTIVAVGSGQAIELARRGGADVLLVHLPDAEARFIEEGYGSGRYPLMVNEFVVVGPQNESAPIQRTNSAIEALRRIYAESATFVSRADKSGTHDKEQSLWNLAKLDPHVANWYLKAEAGMAETLRIANEKRAYTLTDRATYLAQRSKLDLEVVVAQDPLLLNHYSVIQLNPARYPQLNHEGAQKFIEFLLGDNAQQIIANFGKDEFGQPLFFVDQYQRDDQ